MYIPPRSLKDILSPGVLIELELSTTKRKLNPTECLRRLVQSGRRRWEDFEREEQDQIAGRPGQKSSRVIGSLRIQMKVFLRHANFVQLNLFGLPEGF